MGGGGSDGTFCSFRGGCGAGGVGTGGGSYLLPDREKEREQDGAQVQTTIKDVKLWSVQTSTFLLDKAWKVSRKIDAKTKFAHMTLKT
eukprot:3498840-Amphidinium_carterae.1